jgi:MFS family permease
MRINLLAEESTFSKYIPGAYSPSRCLRLSGKPMMSAILLLAGCVIMFFGYDASVMSLINTNEDYLGLMRQHRDPSGPLQPLALVSLWYLGFGTGAIFVGHYGDRLGRLKSMELGCLWGLLGAALQAPAQNFTWMAIARIIGGLAVGI